MRVFDYIGETTEYDKKQLVEKRKLRSWMKTISAFANGKGGALLFGIANDDSLIGLENVEADSEFISEVVKTKMDPVPDLLLSIQEEDGRRFILLHVAAGNETPYYYIGDGGRTAYVRIGNESVPADAGMLRKLVLRGSGKQYDALVSHCRKEDLSFAQLRQAYRDQTGQELEESDFVSFGLAEESGLLTNGGLLLADNPPLRQSRLFCTRWHGTNKASGIVEALDDKEFEGGLIFLLQSGLGFVKTNTKRGWKKTKDGRVELPEYPERAVFEALVNALIHRDYLDTGSEVHIDIYDDRLEIYSPGGMCDGTVSENLFVDQIPSRRRNPIIADVFGRLRYMERRGSGFKKIQTAYQNAENYSSDLAPLFSSTHSSFFVVLHNLMYKNCGQPKVANEGQKVANESQKVANESQKVANESQKVANEGQKVANEGQKVANEGQKVANESQKVANEGQKVANGNSEDRANRAISESSLSKRNKEKTHKLYYALGSAVFGRAQIMNKLGMAYSTAGKYLNELKEAEIIEAVKGKGKYRFRSF